MCGTISEDTRELLEVITLLIPPIFYILALEGRSTRLLYIIGLIFHLGALVLRGVLLGWVPLTEKHDNLIFMSLVTALVYYYYLRKEEFEKMHMLGLPVVSVLSLLPLGYRTINSVGPFIGTVWFYLYIFFFFSAMGFFFVSAIVGLYGIYTRRGIYEWHQYQTALYGWAMLSFSMLFGSIWFYLAYGTYWLWTSKELWSTITWFFVGLYLHARLLRFMQGRPAMVIGVMCLLAIVFTYFGIGPGKIIQSPPTQF